MEAQRLKLSALWVSLMLTYLLGDVLRIFSSDFVAGENCGHAEYPGTVPHRRHCPGDPDRHGFPILDVEASREPLGEHFRSDPLVCV